MDSSNIHHSHKRIAKNTLFLYFRMFISMGVSFYTSRVILDVLGASDYGIYVAVGGIVIMLGFLNAAMSTATQRFLSFELGKGDNFAAQKVFNHSVVIHALIAILVVVFAETLGLWFLNNKLVIPPERVYAAKWIYQFSVLTFILSVMSVPFHATIISNEKMNVFAWISLLEVSFKLAVAFILVWISFDKLILYASLIFIVGFIILVLYVAYCITHFEECRFKFSLDRILMSKMLSLSGWNLFAYFAGTASNQGLVFMLNNFFGTIASAANGLAMLVNGALSQFIANFQTAINPQIIKTYARDERENSFSLAMLGSRFSFFIFYMLAVPLYFNADFFLNIWLKDVPENAILFTRLTIIYTCIMSTQFPLSIVAQASGKNKLFYSVEGLILIMNIPISYVFLRRGFPVYTPFIVMSLISLINLLSKLVVLYKIVHFPIVLFFKKVLLRIVIIVLLTMGTITFVSDHLSNVCFWKTILYTSIMFIYTLLIIFLFGLNREEKGFVIRFLHKKYSI